MSGALALQATIGGMTSRSAGAGETVYAAFDQTAGVLLIHTAKTVRPGTEEKRMQGCAVCTNNAAAYDFDSLFKEEHIQDAISAYYSMSGRGLVVLQGSAEMHNPSNAIEVDGIDERGRKFRFNQTITDGQVAILAMCWFASRQVGFMKQMQAIEDAADWEVLTVGLPGQRSRSDIVYDTNGDAIATTKRRIVRYEMGGQLPIGEDGWPI